MSAGPSEIGDARGGAAEFYVGPMYAEKTTEVGRRIRRARLAGLSCVFVKYAADDRYGAGPVISTHDGATIESQAATADLGRLRVVVARELAEVDLAPDERDVGVDEGQFYPDLRAAVDRWMCEGRRVYVAALDGDFRRQAFPAIAEALPLATHITKLSAVCMSCGRAGRRPAEASYTVRTVPSDSIELIGAKGMYQAACLECYLGATRPPGKKPSG